MYGILWTVSPKMDLEAQVKAAARRFKKRTGLTATTVQIPGHEGNGLVLAGLAAIGGSGYSSVILVGIEVAHAAPEDGGRD